MTYTILTLFPGAFDGYMSASILGRSICEGKVNVRLVNIRDFARDKHKSCDDASYGGGPGMVLKPEPLAEALDHVEASSKRVIYPTPAGRLFDQRCAESFARESEIVIICGRYEGIDQRVVDAYVTDEISVGDYVLSGGEAAAIVLVDAITRLVKGVIRDESLGDESFADGLLEYPQYTRPEEYRGMRVPEVLLSGHHEQIRRWRLAKSVQKTLKYRAELLRSSELEPEARSILEELERRGDQNE